MADPSVNNSLIGDAPAAQRRRRRFSRRLQNRSPLPVDDDVDDGSDSGNGAQEQAPDADAAGAGATGNQVEPLFTLDELPPELKKELVTQFDVSSLCRLYVACGFRELKHKNDVKIMIEDRLKKLTVCVTPAARVGESTTTIDFETLALLPPWCDVHVKTPVAFWELSKKYLLQLKFALLSLTIYDDLLNSNLHQNYVDLRGIKGYVVAVHLVDIHNYKVSDIPETIEDLSLTRCTIRRFVDLTHLTRLSHVDILAHCKYGDDNSAGVGGYFLHLPELVTSLYVLNDKTGNIFASDLPKLQHYHGRFVDLKWFQLKTATVDYIAEGTQCDLLKEVNITDLLKITNFQTIHCPNLRDVLLNLQHPVEITDIFTYDQLIQLKSFKGKNVRLGDLTLLEQIKVLHVQYNLILAADTPLSPQLVELEIVTPLPVRGIPLQLTGFGYKHPFLSSPQDVSVTSATLKRLLITGANRIIVNCPHLDKLTLGWISSIVECDTPEVRDLSLWLPCLSVDRFPYLRHLRILDQCMRELADVEVDYHLESVTLEGVKLGRVSFSANEVSLKKCWLTQTPSITVKVLSVQRTAINGGITCQELTCDTIAQIPSMVEKASLRWLPANPRGLFDGCDNLTSLFIDSADGVRDTLVRYKLVIPTSVRLLKLPVKPFRFTDSKIFKKPQTLEFFLWGDTKTEWQVDPPPKDIADEFLQLGYNLWCRPDKLQIKQPSETKPEN